MTDIRELTIIKTSQASQKKLAIILTLPSLGGLELNLLKFFKYKTQNISSDSILILAKGSAAEGWVIKEKLPYFTISKPRKYFSLKQALELKKIISTENAKTVLISTSQDLDLLCWAHVNTKIVFYQQMQLGVAKKNFYQQWKFRHISFWLAPLPWLKEELLQKSSFDPAKIFIVPLCLDTKTFSDEVTKTNKKDFLAKHHLTSDTFLFGIIGRIDPGKGQLAVIKSFAQLLQTSTYPHPIKLCIVGSSTLHDEKARQYETKINEAIQELQIENYILKIPHLHNPANIYAVLNALIVASEKETFGMVTVEGLLAKLVVIGANSGGTVDILENGKHGLLYNPQIPNDLYLKMQEALLNFQHYYEKISQVNFSEEYDFKRLENFLESHV